MKRIELGLLVELNVYVTKLGQRGATNPDYSKPFVHQNTCPRPFRLLDEYRFARDDRDCCKTRSDRFVKVIENIGVSFLCSKTTGYSIYPKSSNRS